MFQKKLVLLVRCNRSLVRGSKYLYKLSYEFKIKKNRQYNYYFHKIKQNINNIIIKYEKGKVFKKTEKITTVVKSIKIW